jgi:hypothetical protein
MGGIERKMRADAFFAQINGHNNEFLSWCAILSVIWQGQKYLSMGKAEWSFQLGMDKGLGPQANCLVGGLRSL